MTHFKAGDILIGEDATPPASGSVSFRVLHRNEDGSANDIHTYTVPDDINIDPNIRSIEQIADKLYISASTRILTRNLNDDDLGNLYLADTVAPNFEDVRRLVTDSQKNGNLFYSREPFDDLVKLDRLTGTQLQVYTNIPTDPGNDRFTIFYDEPCVLYVSEDNISKYNVCTDAFIAEIGIAGDQVFGLTPDQVDKLLYVGLAIDAAINGTLRQYDRDTSTLLQSWTPLHHGPVAAPWFPREIALSKDRQTVWMISGSSNASGNTTNLLVGLDVSTGIETVIDMGIEVDIAVMHIVRPAGGVPFSQVIGAS